MNAETFERETARKVHLVSHFDMHKDSTPKAKVMDFQLVVDAVIH